MTDATLPNPITLPDIREAIGQVESGGDYTARNPKSSASGKYQYTEGTWTRYGGYECAADAPPDVQDEMAIKDLQARHRRYKGDVEKIIAAHYYPKWANNKSLWNVPPFKGSPTVREYVNRVLKVLNSR